MPQADTSYSNMKASDNRGDAVADVQAWPSPHGPLPNWRLSLAPLRASCLNLRNSARHLMPRLCSHLALTSTCRHGPLPAPCRNPPAHLLTCARLELTSPPLPQLLADGKARVAGRLQEGT